MRWVTIFVSGVLLTACTTTNETVNTVIDVPDLAVHHAKARPWTSLDSLDGPERFHFVVVTDRTSRARPGVFRGAMDKVNLVQPAFVMSVGDLIEGYTEDAAQIEREWNEMEAMTGQLDAPFFYVAGNHDMMNREMEAAWARRFGASYYHFVYKDTLFLVLNAEYFDWTDIEGDSSDRTRGPGHDKWAFTAEHRSTQAAQMTYAEKVLAQNTGVRWTFVFIHKPFWSASWVQPPRDEQTGRFVLDGYAAEDVYPVNLEVTADWARLQALLGDRDYTAFAGHRHNYEYLDFSDRAHTHEHITLATTGGISNLRGVSFGEFDHVLWVTMTDDGPVFANLLLDGILPRDVASPDRRPWWVE